MEERAPRYTEPKLVWTFEHLADHVQVACFLDGLEHWQAVAAKVFYDLRESSPYTVIFPET